jgi:hypothetical protein
MLGYPNSILGSIVNQQQSQRRGLLPPPSTQKYCESCLRVKGWEGEERLKPSTAASNNGRIDGASMCARKGPTLKVIR